MHERILVAGSGGQGIILMGKILAAVAVPTVPHVTFFPAYGAEVRGGTSNGQIVLSSEPISSPVCERFDAQLIMNQASADLFLPVLDEGGLAVLNASMCLTPETPDAVCVPASEMAQELGDIRAANFVMLGAFLARRPMVPPQDMEKQIASVFGRKGTSLIDLNTRAFRAGMAAVTNP